MYRNITIDGTQYKADFTALDNARVTIAGDKITVSSDLTGRTPGAEFEAVFYGRERVEIITAPISEILQITNEVPNPAYIDAETTPDAPQTIQEVQTAPGPDRYDIGPLTPDEDETPLTLAKRAKLAEIAAERWKAETGGITLQGMTIDTSRESQALITGAALQATIDSAYTCQWKTSGGFVTLDAAAVLTVATAVREHVQACFNKEAELTAAVIAAAAIEVVEAVTWN
jgi:hypothetical protein